jgi:hypothetical protein
MSNIETPMSHAMEFMTRAASALREQDNEYTASPIYCIQKHVLVTGIDPEYCSSIGWFNHDDGVLADPKRARALERYYERFGKEHENWARTGYEWQWIYTGQLFLTKAAADAFVGNSDEYRVLVDSAYRNHELKEVRRLLSGPALKCIEALVALKEAVEFIPLGIRGIKAVEQARVALAELDTAREPQSGHWVPVPESSLRQDESSVGCGVRHG